jgi:hypothetical protein
MFTRSCERASVLVGKMEVKSDPKNDRLTVMLQYYDNP